MSSKEMKYIGSLTSTEAMWKIMRLPCHQGMRSIYYTIEMRSDSRQVPRRIDFMWRQQRGDARFS